MDDTAALIGQDLARLLRVVARQRHQAETYVLGVLLEKGPQRVGEIARAGGGGGAPRPHPADGRAHLLAVTPAGEQRCADGRRHRIAMVASVLSGWPEDSRRQLATLLGQFADGLQEHGVKQ
jgi:hypothetical protein